MKFGVREICDVVLKAKAPIKIGNKKFYKNEPVIYFDSLKTSSMEGAATTVYAQGGRGNARLVAWEGERTVTFTMEDALISPAGFMILSGAGLIEGSTTNTIKVHTTEQVKVATVTADAITINLSKKPYAGVDSTGAPKTSTDDLIYVMVLDDHGDVITEPYCLGISVGSMDATTKKYPITIPAANNDLSEFTAETYVLVDYYVEKSTDKTQQIEITADKFGGNYYLEASTLFRNTDGVDMPAEFIIPNCKIQSNFTFNMASSGDPSTFTFTIDAFPDYTRFDGSKKVLAAIQIVSDDDEEDETRQATSHTFGTTTTPVVPDPDPDVPAGE